MDGVEYIEVVSFDNQFSIDALEAMWQATKVIDISVDDLLKTAINPDLN